MHDLDRAMFETGEIGHETHEAEQQEFLELLAELDGGRPAERPRTSSEAEQAAELLEVQSAAELDRFLGSLLSRVGGAARDFARSDTGMALGGILRAAARDALPVVGRAIGTAAGGANHGATGERVGRAAGALFGLELEGLSQEDREFELAKAFVRFAEASGRQAASAPSGADPKAVAKAAAITAARAHAPGLLAALAPAGGQGDGRGRWERRGDTIVIYGV